MTGSRFGRTVREHMSEVGVAFRTADFHANHAMRGVSDAGDPRPFNFLVEAGPATTGIEFGAVRKESGVADLAVVVALAGFSVELTGEGALGSIPAQDAEFFGRQSADEVGVIVFGHGQP